jgi:hypothetical protein
MDLEALGVEAKVRIVPTVPKVPAVPVVEIVVRKKEPIAKHRSTRLELLEQLELLERLINIRETIADYRRA